MRNISIARLFLTLITAVFTFGASTYHSFASDFSTLNVLGFSDDGKIFAFEEYGIQDGSGSPYATRSYINTANDSFVGGSPFRIQASEMDQDLTLEIVRAKAKALGQAIVTDAALQDGYLAGFNAITETSADPYRMIVLPRPIPPSIDGEILFQMKEQNFAATGICKDVLPEGTAKGFELTAVKNAAGQEIKVLHSDNSVPKSRGCTFGYRLGGVYTHFEGATPAYAILIAVKSFGFEGPDYRWMAVTTTADKLQ